MVVNHLSMSESLRLSLAENGSGIRTNNSETVMKGDDGTRDGTRDGKWITRVEARTLLLAKSKCIHFSKNRFSARLVEDACQRKQNDTKLPLGHRLHRARSTGAFND